MRPINWSGSDFKLPPVTCWAGRRRRRRRGGTASKCNFLNCSFEYTIRPHSMRSFAADNVLIGVAAPTSTLTPPQLHTRRRRPHPKKGLGMLEWTGNGSCQKLRHHRCQWLHFSFFFNIFFCKQKAERKRKIWNAWRQRRNVFAQPYANLFTWTQIIQFQWH